MRSILFILFFIPSFVHSQTVCTLESRQRLDSALNMLSHRDHSQKSMNDLTIEIGTWFLNTPYVEKTLELPGDEKLVVNLMGLDCTTYLETVVSLARTAKGGKLTFEAYTEELEKLRYRHGVNDGYSSRLHYFSDWIYQNEEKGILKDISKEIGGSVYENNPSFMTSNPKFYPQLSNPDYINQLKETESEIKSRKYYYLPKAEIKAHENKIKSGDLIAITTSITNLDIVHVGFAIEKEGRIHLLHASSGSKKVEISEKPLSDYLMANKSQSGIMVSRLVEAGK
ncbi:DUF1460 domain-containing protein [Aquiflexum sp. TKW24L]|uniref:N-acetylmuramoyl-L-alanine amidase-like domain-containing protein n=1 Tax=Aquiflexum sp. TKW24L TaxID=2942212 RepID=UPI0020BF00E8|nr:N-acetylmuramoyl-L-alanine amidase-like domain-containing protein [Aquiflexum sp. TKW24L]MCL6260151.1 DUF1460 domain-containing protein [Aquiflexum sp. TKW24L]